MFKHGLSLYKHNLNTDVAFSVIKQFTKPNGDIKLKVKWFNIVNPDNIFPIDDDKILITKEQIKNWKLYK